MDMNLVIIPKNLKVGFQKRSDTYAGKLGYVIYNDGKKWRKEVSFEGWRDKKIDSVEFINEPTEGFVINHEVGGVRNSWSSWNPRTEKIRVYDPRGFEMELSIPNILFLLQECSSIKGKGLEGKFVYAWDKTELVLIPITCQEYVKATEYTEKVNTKFDKKSLKEGFRYITKDGKLTHTYMGKFICWGNTLGFGKMTHVFCVGGDSYGNFLSASNPDYDSQVGEDPDPNFTEKYQELVSNKRTWDSDLKVGKAVSISVKPEESNNYSRDIITMALRDEKYAHNLEKCKTTKTFIEKDGNFYLVEISGGYSTYQHDPATNKHVEIKTPISIKLTQTIYIRNGEIFRDKLPNAIEMSKESFLKFKYGKLCVTTDFGQSYEQKK